jgi:hypothetical protein
MELNALCIYCHEKIVLMERRSELDAVFMEDERVLYAYFLPPFFHQIVYCLRFGLFI